MTHSAMYNSSPTDHAVVAEVQRLGISEVRHFTTNRGLLGVLRGQALLSRSYLAQDDVVDLVTINNCFRRWDTDWFGYVNLSIQRINGWLYDISSGRWHNDEALWWVVLGFDPIVLAHLGVIFVTTNNGFSVACRATGVSGLRALWADEVRSARGSAIYGLNRNDRPWDQPTDPQAEALYPQSLSTRWLRTVYVGDAELVDSVRGYVAATSHPEVDVVFYPEAFS